MPKLDEVLEWLFFVPKPLRRATALAVIGLPALAELLAQFEKFDFVDALTYPLWLSASVLVCAVLLILTLRARPRIVKRIPWAVSLATLALVLGAVALQHSAYEYNELGLYQQRTWQRSPIPPPDPKTQSAWEWQIIAVQNMEQSFLIVALAPTPECPVAVFQPLRTPTYIPDMTDVTDDLTHSRRWRIPAFRKPAVVAFRLVIDQIPTTTPRCLPQITIWRDK